MVEESGKQKGDLLTQRICWDLLMLEEHEDSWTERILSSKRTGIGAERGRATGRGSSISERLVDESGKRNWDLLNIEIPLRSLARRARGLGNWTYRLVLSGLVDFMTLILFYTAFCQTPRICMFRPLSQHISSTSLRGAQLSRKTNGLSYTRGFINMHGAACLRH